jgi:hypothetical protein
VLEHIQEILLLQSIRRHKFLQNVPLVKFAQSEYWGPNPDRQPVPAEKPCAWAWFDRLPFTTSSELSHFRFVMIALGWFLTTMGVAGLTGLVRRD